MDKIINLSLATRDVPQKFDWVQNATEPDIVFVLDDYTPGRGSTATLYINKPSGGSINGRVVISGNNLTYDVIDDSFSEVGIYECQLRIVESDGTSYTFMLSARVEPNMVKARASSIVSTDEYGMLVETLQNARQYETVIGANNYTGANSQQYWTILPSGADLNDPIYRAPGIYAANSTVGKTILNTPRPGAQLGFKMVVGVATAVSATRHQEIRYFDSANASTTYRRIVNGTSGTWSAWNSSSSSPIAEANNIVGYNSRQGWTALTTGEDLNIKNIEGVYYAGTDSIAASLLNCPVRSLFKMVVERFGQNYLTQEIFLQGTGSSLQKWKRVSGNNGSTWNDWMPMTFYITGSITDLNDAVRAGYYNYGSNTSNAPTSNYGTVLVLRWGVSNIYQICMPFGSNTADGHIFIRQYYGNNWYDWVCLTGDINPYLTNYIYSGDDLNNYKKAGIWHVLSTDVAGIDNMPVATQGVLKVILFNPSYQMQEYRSTLNNIYERRLYTANGETTATPWMRIAKGDKTERLTVTRIANDYVDDETATNFRAYKKNGILFFNGYLRCTTALPSTATWVPVAQIEGWSSLVNTYATVAMQNFSGTIVVQITTDGIVNILNSCGQPINGFCRCSMTTISND